MENLIFCAVKIKEKVAIFTVIDLRKDSFLKLF